MRRIFFVLLLIFLVAGLALMPGALAHNAGPCNDSGDPGNSDYAQHHIVPVAHDGDLGEVDHDGDGMSHNPGSHRGFSACDPSDRE